MSVFDKRFICMGANSKNGYSLSRVGETHTLSEWLEILYPNRGAKAFFEGDNEKDILAYLYENTGKRLEAAR